MRRSIALALFALAVPAAGCSMSVPLLNPKPNIDLDKSSQSMRLDLGTQVSDAFEIPPQNGIRDVKVEHWHQTLVNGFVNGYGDAFALTTQSGAGLSLEITEAQPELTPAAVSGYYGVVAAQAQVRYKARVLQAKGVVCRSNGTVISKTAVNDPSQVKDAVRSAVESMYEVIAKECFEGHGTAAPAAATVSTATKKL